MWLITPVGFFSVVRKPSDVRAKTLTVRARVRSDLEALRAHHLAELGDIHESATNDYRYRATAPQAAVAYAMMSLVETLDYDNFKNTVKDRAGSRRAHLYHDVWDVLYRLQLEPGAYERSVPNALNRKPNQTSL